MLIRITRWILMVAAMLSVLGVSSCSSQKTEFQKKKYKIRKGRPPAQRYYNKYSIFRKRGAPQYRGAKQTTDI
ncbi:MAG: hypothetical protein KDC12_08650 [Flavobacteriales bacterium]|nr:hypothetical protein [Flavobacteriales bacterium]